MRSTATRQSIGVSIVLVVVVATCARAVLTAQAPGVERLDPALLAAFDRQDDASYLVVLRDRADLSGAQALTDRSARGRFVHSRLQQQADESQRAVRAFLLARQQSGEVRQFRPFWIVNAIAVRSTKAVAIALTRFTEVERIVSPVVASIPPPEPSEALAAPVATEWNLTQIGAPTLWSFGVKGQGITVANIDTGVQFNHPALVAQYRGNLGGGVFDHNYNWWDASGFFGGPGDLVPTDNDGHGTHTMGTMVGDDGGANQIGAAPKANWMACKACAGASCSFFGLLECGQFVLAPWNLAEQNPNPDRRPHVVNNSWSFAVGGFDIYRSIVQSWRAAGIFPAFAIGNDGRLGCNTARSPGDYPESFASGATDIADAIADFSGRGPSLFGNIAKPDAAAPGVAVRSSVPTNSYATFSGTSMASPHTAGLVALLWSYYPGLVRDVDSTEKKLRPAARIINTTQACGGDSPTTHPNNVFGWGRHDAVAALMPANTYTDKSEYSPGETTNLRLSLVNPIAGVWNVDLHFGLMTPNGNVTLLASQPVALPSLGEFFDIDFGSHTWSTEAAGQYVWFTILTAPGADPTNPANRLSIDTAPMLKK